MNASEPASDVDINITNLHHAISIQDTKRIDLNLTRPVFHDVCCFFILFVLSFLMKNG